MNRSTIEFCDFTWNPITGCSFGCPFCYARKFSDRYKLQKNFSVPEFHPERLKEKFPGMPKKRNRIAQIISPDKPVIFVGSMCDIFSNEVESEWIYDIMDVAHDHPNHTFLFLSKNPGCFNLVDQMCDIAIPDNCICGTSIEKASLGKRIKDLREFRGRKWVSVEPLMSRFDQVNFSGMEFVVVGAMTGGSKPLVPQKEWALSVKHEKVYYKDNILRYYPELK
jgi:protein gp37